MGACCYSEGRRSLSKGDKPEGRGKAPRKIKLAIIGGAQSGKSTLVKQLVRIHKGDLDPKRRRDYISIIARNILMSVEKLISKSEGLGLEEPQLLYAEERGMDVEVVRAYIEEQKEVAISPRVGKAIERIWGDPGIQACVDIAGQPNYAMNDSAEYFFENLERVCNPAYIPSMDDIVIVRCRTAGIYEKSFEFDGCKFTLYDLGGQKSERKKWNHVLGRNDLNGILFLVAVSGYDIPARENPSISQLEESFEIFVDFNKTCKEEKRSFILLLNKYDIFYRKIGYRDITCNPLLKNFKFDGKIPDQKPVRAMEYIEKLFLDSIKKNDTSREWYCHVTNATNEQMITHVFWDVKDKLFEASLQETGLMI
mmetsp:Transcript_13682/g.24710  ORF Transcript_13682/g.24710 Transcript_13682/m.24710 type:complete len:367 (+) Transcript_13682:411-1511(+)|eukprot:CAMPEP_0197515950 /NCGR_PEP_ID=MMETSP1318-20131121/898_1 /TAXON_ID=552666 /ORGANISM="Partenskyella glossopodia, Strain RCC365" /LENGTH=366 /DNA_ID=CAMNT_0043064435 /DNA_START=391 /DNA_END=1491 /DNA_ORIENTATION=-